MTDSLNDSTQNACEKEYQAYMKKEFKTKNQYLNGVVWDAFKAGWEAKPVIAGEIWYNEEQRQDFIDLVMHECSSSRQPATWVVNKILEGLGATVRESVAVISQKIFEDIKHGDAEHQAWLKRELVSAVERALA